MAAILKYKIMEDEDGTISIVKNETISKEDRYQQKLLHRRGKNKRLEEDVDNDNEERASLVRKRKLSPTLTKKIMIPNGNMYDEDEDEEFIKNILYKKYKSKYKGGKTLKMKSKGY